MKIADFVGWWNWLFLAPFAIGVTLVALSVLGLGDDDGEGALDGDGALEGDSDESGWLGLPSLMSVQSFALWWGALGWSANRLLGNAPSSLGASVPLALIGGAVLTLATKRALQKLGAQGATTVLHAGGLEGRVGEAAGRITSTCGAALVRDEHGTLHRIAARTQVARTQEEVDVEPEAIGGGETVLVVAYDEASQLYRVQRWGNGLG